MAIEFDQWVQLTDQMHTAPTAEQRAEAKRQRLDLELAATGRARQRWYAPALPLTRR